MGLTGLEIFKQLPKTNCKECGQPTCLAFAMALASSRTALEMCPHLSAAAREVLESASAPPIALIEIGTGDKKIQLGNETVLFRHEKRFEHKPGLAVMVADTLSGSEIAQRVRLIDSLGFDRVGQVHGVDMIAVVNRSGSCERFASAVKDVSELSDLPLILVAGSTKAAGMALDIAGKVKPLLCCAVEDNAGAMTELAKKFGVPLVVRGNSLDELASLVEKVQGMGHKEIILDPGSRDIDRVLADQTQIRRLALRKVRQFGYPSIAWADGQDPYRVSAEASVYIAKYAGIVVLDTVDPAVVLPLVTMRMNIYTDPQKPISVESKLYEVGQAGPDSPVFITTNFSLTFFCVTGDVESSRIPGYVLPVDTDGVSVMTGWAAGKFTAEKIAGALKNCGIEEKVNHRKVIIPGGVAVLSGKLQEVSGWEVIVGPTESAAIGAFLKQKWSV